MNRQSGREMNNMNRNNNNNFNRNRRPPPRYNEPRQNDLDAPRDAPLRDDNREGNNRRFNNNRRPPVNVDRRSGFNPGRSLPVPGAATLSTKDSAMTTDPLYADNYFTTSSSDYAAIEQRVFTPEMTGLIGVLDAEYTAIHARNQHFARTVSLGLFRYYGVMLTWARLFKIQMLNQFRFNFVMDQLVTSVTDGNYTVPKLLGHYINGLGNFTLPSGREYKLKLPDVTWTDGFFGAIANNPDKYCNLVSPGVIVRKILQDRNLQPPGAWDLPENYAMANHPINEKCLGYAPSVGLSLTTLETYNNLEIHGEMPTTIPECLYNPSLMNRIQAELCATRNLELAPFNLTTANGSKGLMIYATIIRDGTNPSNTTYRGDTPVKIPGQISNLAEIFLYRRDLASNPGATAPVSRPTAAVNNLIIAYHSEDAAILEEKEFRGVEFIPNDRLGDFADKDFVVK